MASTALLSSLLSGRPGPLLLWGLLGGLVSFYVLKAFVTYFRTRRFPGPFWTTFSGFPHARAMLGAQVHEWYGEISEKYGAIYALPPLNFPFTPFRPFTDIYLSLIHI